MRRPASWSTMITYLDNNATTPLDERVLESMLPWLHNRRGNPSSVHAPGRAARAAIGTAREQVADLVGTHPGQVVFTSGGTESNNLALKGIAGTTAPAHLLVSAIEHASVLGPARALRARGWRLGLVPVDEAGRVTPQNVRTALHPDTRLVSVMWANNETGVVQDVPAIAVVAREAGALLHTDAVQAAGKLPLDFLASGAHLMSVSAHKLYGPAGIGALIVDPAVELEPLLHGGGQERGRRGGTENVAAIVGFGTAAELARRTLAARSAHLRELRDALETAVRKLPGVRVLAADADRLPNTSQLLVPGIEGETLLMNLDREGVAVSSGSACASGKSEPSHVLLAMGVDPDLARCAIRVSLGVDNTHADVARLVEALAGQLAMLRSMAARAAGM